MLSRHANACYWIGRYVERAEATARIVDVHYHAALEHAGSDGNGEEASPEVPHFALLRWQSILAISGNQSEFGPRHESADRDAIHFFAFDEENPDSILRTWSRARENARSIREMISSEMWESLNISNMQLREWDADRVLGSSPHEFFQAVKNASHLFQGILNRTMIMGETRDWLDTGRFIERAIQTTRLLDVKYHDLLPVITQPEIDTIDEGTAPGQITGAIETPYGVGGPIDIHGWTAVLKSVSAYEMYRKTYRDGIMPSSVVEFLLLSSSFPASVRHGISRVEGCLRRISGNRGDTPLNEPERLIDMLSAELRCAEAQAVVANGLHEYLQAVLNRCAAIGASVTRTFLSY